MNLEQQLNQSISRWSLLDSEFYQAWNAGTLPVEALATYAREYGAFISKIAGGWSAHGDEVTAVQEREHAELWRRFARALGTDIGSTKTPAVAELLQVAEHRFSDSVESLGALYAFEAQQPATSKSKLEGLRRHYNVDPNAERYFVVHAEDEDEPALLLGRMQSLSGADQARAAAACEQMAQALRGALDGLYETCYSPTV